MPTPPKGAGHIPFEWQAAVQIVQPGREIRGVVVFEGQQRIARSPGSPQKVGRSESTIDGPQRLATSRVGAGISARAQAGVGPAIVCAAPWATAK